MPDIRNRDGALLSAESEDTWVAAVVTDFEPIRLRCGYCGTELRRSSLRTEADGAATVICSGCHRTAARIAADVEVLR